MDKLPEVELGEPGWKPARSALDHHMNANPVCPRCGVIQTRDGLCPRCELSVALETSPAAPQEARP